MGDGIVRVAGHVEHLDVPSRAFDQVGQSRPAHVRHHDVGEKEMDHAGMPFGEAERVLGILTFQHGVPHAREDVTRQGAKVWVVFDKQDDLGPSSRCRVGHPDTGRPGDLGPGQVDAEGRPPPGWLSTVMYPPLCLMMPYAVARPSPVPLPTGFVVKNGSKIRDTVAASIPTPVSVIERTSYGPGSSPTFCRANTASTSTWRVSRTREPPPGIASRELTAMLRITCSICPG